MIHAETTIAKICEKIDQSNYQQATIDIAEQVKELLCLEYVSYPFIDAKRYAVEALLRGTEPAFEKDHAALIALSAALRAWSESVAWADQTLRLVRGSNPN